MPLPAAELLGDRLARGEFQVAVLPFAIGLDPDLYPLLAASQTRTGGSNVVGLQDPDLDKLLVAARTPVDEAARIAAYAALQKRLAASARTCSRWPSADDYVVFRDTVVGPESQARRDLRGPLLGRANMAARRRQLSPFRVAVDLTPRWRNWQTR